MCVVFFNTYYYINIFYVPTISIIYNRYIMIDKYYIILIVVCARLYT